MKNTVYIILLITVAALAFMSGLFLGRYHDDGTISAQVEEKADAVGKVDLNNGTIDELCMIPGISEIMAQRIVDYREKNGPFENVDDLCLVSGISETRLEELRSYIMVGD